jgi:hypothetical protein
MRKGIEFLASLHFCVRNSDSFTPYPIPPGRGAKVRAMRRHLGRGWVHGILDVAQNPEFTCISTWFVRSFCLFSGGGKGLPGMHC